MHPSTQNDTACSIVTVFAAANVNETMNIALPHVAAAFVHQWSYLRDSIMNLSLLTVFFGLFTVLAATAAYILLSKGKLRKATAIMLLAIGIMWASTAAYWIAILVVVARVLAGLQDLTEKLLNGTDDVQECQLKVPGLAQLPSYNAEMSRVQNCAVAVALTVNVVIGDVIVWWRAWVLWPDSRMVRLICVLTILITIVAGVISDVQYACGPVPSDIYSEIGLESTTDASSRLALGSGTDISGLLSMAVSILTNGIATALISYRAWQHRRAIMSYLKEVSPRTQVERTLALLVESGLLYCALCVIVTVYDTSDTFPSLKLAIFAGGFVYVMRGCMVPIIGMYPTLVIIICAVEKSLYERSLSGDTSQHASIVFNPDTRRPARRRRETLSGLTSSASGYAAEVNPGSCAAGFEDGDNTKTYEQMVAMDGSSSCIPMVMSSYTTANGPEYELANELSPPLSNST